MTHCTRCGARTLPEHQKKIKKGMYDHAYDGPIKGAVEPKEEKGGKHRLREKKEGK